MRARLRDAMLRMLGAPPPPAMTVDNVYGYLDALSQLRDVPGPVVEVGCAHGGTTVLACRFLSRLESRKDYYCIDTFSGFVPEQLETDHGLGLGRNHDGLFRENSKRHFERNLAAHGIRRNVHVVQGDICTMDPSSIPNGVSVALLDVDLRDPIYGGLQRLYPNLVDGGVILVDDCKAGTSWVGANVGYQDFVAEMGIAPKYFMGFGVIEKPGPVSHLKWACSSTPNPAGGNYFA